MRKKLFLRIITLIIGVLYACHKEETNYYTSVMVALNFPNEIKIIRLQGTITLTNLNNKKVYTTSDIGQLRTILQVMKGAYSLSGEGSVRYTNRENKDEIRHFRVSKDYCEVLNQPTIISAPIIWL